MTIEISSPKVALAVPNSLGSNPNELDKHLQYQHAFLQTVISDLQKIVTLLNDLEARVIALETP